MKKFLLLLAAATAFAVSAQNEISVSYGAFPVGSKFMPDVLMNHGSGPSSSYPGTDFKSPISYSDIKSWGSVNVMYMRDFSSKFAGGVSYSYSSFKADEMNPTSDFGLPTTHSHSVMLNARWKWVSGERFTLYSRVGAGARFNSASLPNGDATNVGPVGKDEILKKNKTDFAWQVSAIGADYKVCDHFRVFAEAGAGVQGCIQAGVKTIF